MAKLEDISNDWASIISFISNKPATNSIWSVIQRLVLGAYVYFVWQERNFRCFRKEFRDVDSLLKTMVGTVRLKLLGLNIRYSPNSIEAANIWDLKIIKDEYYRRMVEEILKHNYDND